MSKDLRINNKNFVDQNNRISFKFNDQSLYGYKGDTLASALLANNIHLIGRSFKYHRPRGIMTCGSEEPNAIVQVGNDTSMTEPNARATEIELYEGLEASSQNCWPSVNFDIGAINNFFSPFIPAAFYYKTFMWPASFWNKYEYFIRKSAGLGKSPTEPDKDIYDHKYLHCDVLVIGGGISGIIAAKTAANKNLNTVLLDDKNALGGTTLFQNNECFKINNSNSNEWLRKEIENLNSFENLTVKTRTTLAAYHSYNYLLARENLTDHLILNEKKDKIRQRLWKIRAKKVIIATGSMERPLIFNNNDRPGIILSSSIKKYLDYYGVKCGQKISLFTNNDTAYETAISLNSSGATINSVIDIRNKSNSSIVKQAEKLGIKIHWNHTVVNTNGYKRINSVELMKLSEDGTRVEGNKIKEECDCLGISGGWTPRVHLFTQSGGKLKFRDKDNVFITDKSPSEQISIGSCNGDFDLDDVVNNSNNLVKEFLNINKSDYENLEINCSKEVDKKNIWLLPSDKPLGKTKPFLDFQNDSISKRRKRIFMQP